MSSANGPKRSRATRNTGRSPRRRSNDAQARVRITQKRRITPVADTRIRATRVDASVSAVRRRSSEFSKEVETGRTREGNDQSISLIFWGNFLSQNKFEHFARISMDYISFSFVTWLDHMLSKKRTNITLKSIGECKTSVDTVRNSIRRYSLSNPLHRRTPAATNSQPGQKSLLRDRLLGKKNLTVKSSPNLHLHSFSSRKKASFYLHFYMRYLARVTK